MTSISSSDTTIFFSSFLTHNFLRDRQLLSQKLAAFQLLKLTSFELSRKQLLVEKR